MKVISALCFVASVAAKYTDNVPQEFLDWSKSYGKQYHESEKDMRLSIWMANNQFVEKHNAMNKSYTLKMNEFGDLTTYEFASHYNNYHHQGKTASPYGKFKSEYVNVPNSMDWRTKGYVTEVKDQAQCGSCYSFSATGSLEGAWFKKTGDLISISEQQIVDCSQGEGNMGCNGGLMDDVFQYIMDAGGIEKEVSYPYHATDGTCSADKSKFVVTCAGYKDVESGDEDQLKRAIATVGPIAVAIDASNMSFQFYSSGVYDEPYCSSYSLDHGVLAVGYGTLRGQDHYIVKNSWGSSWGQNGYLMMSRNKNNQCGIATQASYPLV